MRFLLTLLLVIATSFGCQAKKDNAYWNKMADGMSTALINNFWEPSSKDTLVVITSTMAVISPT